jgi:hypothetical protein
MSSRLFRAIVGVGISLGATSAACIGTGDGGLGVTEDGGPETEDPTTSSSSADSSSGDAAKSKKDARADASVDAPKDAILDAFCDATWPTTKGNSGGPTCGPIDACSDAGPAPRCYAEIGPSVCATSGSSSSSSSSSGSSQVFAAWCVGGKWECSSGAIPESECKCWGPLEAGQGCP